jgi:hypothetical protein
MSFGFIALAFSMREENARAIKPKDMIATID